MTTSAETARLDLPVGWVPLPRTGSNQEGWADAYVAELGLEEAAAFSLHFGLLAVMNTAAAMRPGERQSYAFIEDPTTGMVRALLSVQVWGLPAAQRQVYRERIEAENTAEGIEVINQTFEERILAAGPAIVMHDFTVAVSEGEQPVPALERGVVALFVEGTDAMIELSMYTQDLLLFDDMTAYLVELAEGFVPA